MFRFLLLHLLVVSTFWVRAAEPDNGKVAQAYTRSQIVGLALQGNKSLQAARMIIERAEAQLDGAGLRPSPELAFGYSTDRTFGDEGQSAARISLQQRFPVTNRLSLLKDIAAVEVELASLEVRNQERLLALQVEEMCTEIAFIEAKLAIREALIENDRAFLEFVQSRVEAAEASPLETNQMKIELFLVEQEIEHLETDRMALLEELRALVGREVGDAIVLSHRLELPAETPVLVEYSVEGLAAHPEYMMFSLLLDIAGKRESLAVTERWGDVAFGLEFKQERSVDNPVGLGNERFWGVTVSLPLPNKKRVSSLLSEEFAARRELERRLEAKSLELRSRARAIRAETLHLFHQSKEFQDKIKSLVELNVAEMAAAYQAGQVSLSDVFRSQSQRLQVQSTHLEILRDFEQAYAEWRAAVAQNS